MNRLRSIGIFVVAAVFAPVATFAQTHGGGSSSQAAPGAASSTSTVTLTVPAVVAIDVETDLDFDLSAKLPTSGNAGGTCVDDVFPPAPGCTGPAIYTATTSSTTTGLTAPPAGEVWLSLFSNKSGATVTLTATQSAWSAANPVSTLTDLELILSAGTTNSLTGAPAAGSPQAISAGSGTASLGTATGAFGWTRQDQLLRLRVEDGSGNASGVVFTNGAGSTTYTTTVTFTATST